MNLITVKPRNEVLKEFEQLVIKNDPNDYYYHWFDNDRLNGHHGFEFENIELVLLDNTPIAFSGCSIVEGKLRVLQQLYTLPQHRKKYRDTAIREGGFIDRHMQTAKRLDIDTLLVAVHTFNQKTKTMENVWLNKRHKYRHFKNFEYKGVKLINNCDQHLFEMKI